MIFYHLFIGFVLLNVSLALNEKSRADTLSNIVDQCYSYLESHLCEGEKWGFNYHFYRPSIDKYSADQWLWDSGSHMIVWSHKNVTNSILDLRTMLQLQQESGFIPEEIFWSERTDLENAQLLLTYSNINYTDITQMPVLPYSLRSIYNASQDKEILSEFLYPLINYFKWWRNTRDKGDGLVIAIHNWETGMDASPAYDPAFHTYVTEVNETSVKWLYPKFIEVVESYKFLYHWNVTEILSRKIAPPVPSKIDTWFVVKDLAVNSVYGSGWKVLADLAMELNDIETYNYCMNEYHISLNAILTKMWNSKTNSFQTVYTDSDGRDKFSIANTIQNLFPLLFNDLPQDKLNIILTQLKDNTKFNSIYGIPTVAMDDPQFCPSYDADLMWRGPIWGFTNWFLLEGLGIHGEFALQEEFISKWVTLVDQSGIYEMYDPITGAPYGQEGLGMSTLICDWLYRYGWVTN